MRVLDNYCCDFNVTLFMILFVCYCCVFVYCVVLLLLFFGFRTLVQLLLVVIKILKDSIRSC